MIKGVESNKKGFFTKEDVQEIGLPIMSVYENDEWVTLTKIRRDYKVKVTQEMMDKYCVGFITKKGMRGYSPVFDLIGMMVDGR